MELIKVIEKPDDIPFDAIHELLFEAHRVNRECGINMSTAFLTGEEIEKRIGKDGKCYVALDGDRVVGTISIRMVERNTWYAKGKIPDYMLVGILPEYQGRGIYTMLAKKVFDFSKQQGYQVLELDTAETNTHAIQVYKHQGFKIVGYKRPNSDHYSVVMAKWLSGCPFSDVYCNIKFFISKIKVRLKYILKRVIKWEWSK